MLNYLARLPETSFLGEYSPGRVSLGSPPVLTLICPELIRFPPDFHEFGINSR